MPEGGNTIMLAIEKFFESPYTALAATIFLAGMGLVALNGRYMTAGYALLAAGWAVAAFGLRSLPPPVLISVMGFIGSTLILIGYFLSPTDLPTNVGVLLSSTSRSSDRLLEIGDSGSTINVGMINFGSSNVLFEVISGKLKVSTQIRDEKGNLVAELVRNEWKIASPPIAWDRNYTANALEVRNAAGKIVLQAVLLPDRIRLQGEWRDTNGFGYRVVKGNNGNGQIIGFEKNPPPDAPEIKPLFVYPSESHLGELKGEKH